MVNFLPPPLNAPPGRVGMEAEIELFPFSSPVRKGGVIDSMATVFNECRLMIVPPEVDH